MITGALGDTWLLSTMAGLAKVPGRVKKIFNDVDSYPDNRQFNLNLFAYGEEKRVAVDDRIPGTVSEGLKPRFAQKSSNGAWWAPILEKASAKYSGSYYNLQGGWMTDAFYMLTGMPTADFKNSANTVDQVWTRLVSNLQKEYVLTATVNCDSVNK